MSAATFCPQGRWKDSRVVEAGPLPLHRETVNYGQNGSMSAFAF